MSYLNTPRYRATYVLIRMGGWARNRHALAQRYHTRDGWHSVKHGYAAVNRAIDAGEIVLEESGEIRLGQPGGFRRGSHA